MAPAPKAPPLSVRTKLDRKEYADAVENLRIKRRRLGKADGFADAAMVEWMR